MPKDASVVNVPTQILCQLTNISECLPIEGQDRFTLTVWNPSTQPKTNVIRVPVTKNYAVRNPTGEIITNTQVLVLIVDEIPFSEFIVSS